MEKTLTIKTKTCIKIIHVLSGDVWGGAESQAFALIVAQSLDMDVRVILFNDGELSQKLRDEFIPVVILNENNGVLFQIKKANKLLRQAAADIIHVHGVKENLITGLASLFFKLNKIRTYHGKGMMEVSWKYNLVEWFCSAFINDAAISVSEDLKLWLSKKGISSQKVNVIRNGLNPSREKSSLPAKKVCARPPGGARQQYVVGTVGRLVPVKNHKLLLRAIGKVKEKNIDIRLVVVGGGPLLSELQNYAKDLGIFHSVSFVGHRANVIDYLHDMDVFVLSSNSEGIPMALLEAIAEGVPVICTRVGGVPEVVTHNVSGLLVESNDVDALGDALIRMVVDAELAPRLVSEANKELHKKASFANCFDQTLKLYRSLKFG